jgi:hypothetical protein
MVTMKNDRGRDNRHCLMRIPAAQPTCDILHTSSEGVTGGACGGVTYGSGGVRFKGFLCPCPD